MKKKFLIILIIILAAIIILSVFFFNGVLHKKMTYDPDIIIHQFSEEMKSWIVENNSNYYKDILVAIIIRIFWLKRYRRHGSLEVIKQK